MTRRYLLLLIFALAFLTSTASVSFAQEPNSAPNELDAYVTRVLKEFEVPGVAVAIVKDGYFALKPDGTIEQMKMKPVSPLTDFSYDLQDLLFTPVTGQ